MTRDALLELLTRAALVGRNQSAHLTTVGEVQDTVERVLAHHLPPVRPMARKGVETGRYYCGRCDHRIEHLVEHGYTRQWGWSVEEEKSPIATYNGVEDFSETGDEQFFLVCGRGHESALPPDTKWEWRL